MFDRIFFPALVVGALIVVSGAFAIDAVRSAAPDRRQTVVQLERVAIGAKRDSQPVALGEAGRSTATR